MAARRPSFLLPGLAIVMTGLAGCGSTPTASPQAPSTSAPPPPASAGPTASPRPQETVSFDPFAPALPPPTAPPDGSLDGRTLADVAPGTDARVHLAHDGLDRTARVIVPATASPDAPLLVVLHSAGSDGDAMLGTTELRPLAEELEVPLVAPDGVNHTWNTGPTCCPPATDQGVDDLGYLRALVTGVADALPGDPAGVVVTGFSNGGFMSYRLACDAADLVDVAIPVAGTMDMACAPSEPVTLVHVHGERDTVVPLVDQRSPASPQADSRGAEDVVRAWARLDGCEGEPGPLPDAEGVRGLHWDTCAAGSTVTLVVAEGQGHTWPRARPDLDTIVSVAVDGLAPHR